MMKDKEKIKQAIKLREEPPFWPARASTLLWEALEDNEEPPPKRIDWSNMPEVLVEVSDNGEYWDKRYFDGVGENGEYWAFSNGTTKETAIITTEWKHIRLIEQPTVTFWKGGECPVPDGVRLEIHFRNNSVCGAMYAASELAWGHNGSALDIIGYRILGPAEGWG